MFERTISTAASAGVSRRTEGRHCKRVNQSKRFFLLQPKSANILGLRGRDRLNLPHAPARRPREYSASLEQQNLGLAVEVEKYRIHDSSSG